VLLPLHSRRWQSPAATFHLPISRSSRIFSLPLPLASASLNAPIWSQFTDNVTLIERSATNKTDPLLRPLRVKSAGRDRFARFLLVP
jgi:hypothetical protein